MSEERRTYSSLVLSLARYVQLGDTKLHYDQFLRLVIDRVVDELSRRLDSSKKE
jgi:hypothetical protein